MKENVILGMVALLLLSPGCSSRKNTTPPLPQTVKVDTVLVYGESKNATFPGKVVAASDINLAFRVSGPIQRINVDVGSRVRQGQVLAEIDSRDYQLQLSATEAQYEQIKREADRARELYERESLSASDYEKALYGFRQISAKYEADRNALQDTKLTAPTGGYIQRRFFQQGETVGAGTAVISMISEGSGEVEINIPSTDYIQRENFEEYYSTVDIFPGKKFPLQLIGITQQANLNQLYTMRFRLVGEDRNIPGPGMSTMVTIVYKPNDSQLVSVPLTSVFKSNDGSSVWIYDPQDSVVNKRNVTLLQILADGSAVISSGLNRGDIIVTAGANSLEEGEKVKLIQPVSSTNVGGML